MLNELELRVAGDIRNGWRYEFFINGRKVIRETGYNSYRAANAAAVAFATEYFSMSAQVEQQRARQRKTS